MHFALHPPFLKAWQKDLSVQKFLLLRALLLFDLYATEKPLQNKAIPSAFFYSAPFGLLFAPLWNTLQPVASPAKALLSNSWCNILRASGKGLPPFRGLQQQVDRIRAEN